MRRTAISYAILGTLLLMLPVLFWILPRASSAPDPTAVAVQGSNTVGTPLLIGTVSGTTIEAVASATDATEAVSAARTTALIGADHTNTSARGIEVYLNVTVASGTGGLQVTVENKDPVSLNYAQINLTPTAVVATGLTKYTIYPGISGGSATQATSANLARVYRIHVFVGDATSYTYSLGTTLLP